MALKLLLDSPFEYLGDAVWIQMKDDELGKTVDVIVDREAIQQAWRRVGEKHHWWKEFAEIREPFCRIAGARYELFGVGPDSRMHISEFDVRAFPRLVDIFARKRRAERVPSKRRRVQISSRSCSTTST